MPSVSVILPTFNRLRYLRAAVESVQAQTLADWELIVADDGSDQETRAFLHAVIEPRLRTILLPHSGNPSRVRNAGIAVARGRYLAFLDSDDVWRPSKLQAQLQLMRDHPQRRWSWTACDRIDEEGRPLAARPAEIHSPRDGWIFEPLLTLDTSIAMPTVVAERALVHEIGGFDEDQLFGEFHDLCVRLALRSAVAYLAEPLCSVRSHAEHYSGDRIAAYKSWIRLHGKLAALAPSPAIRARCRRRRAEASLTLAGLQDQQGDIRAAWATLAAASAFSWPYPGWWFGALKRVARPLVPSPLAAIYRRHARRPDFTPKVP